eukprot:gene2339-3167_t
MQSFMRIILPASILASVLGAAGTLAEAARNRETPSWGSPWSGDMHPGVTGWGSPTCNRTTLDGCQATYPQLKAAGKLWPCPDGRRPLPSEDCTAGCVESAKGGGNPICPGQLTDEKPCCCPMD